MQFDDLAFNNNVHIIHKIKIFDNMHHPSSNDIQLYMRTFYYQCLLLL